MNFLSGKQARHDLRKGEPGFVAWVTMNEANIKDKETLAEMIDPSLNVDTTQRQTLVDLLADFHNIFPKELPAKLPPRRTVEHDIDLELGATPPSRPPYRLSKPEMDELQKQISALLLRGLIEPSKSPYGAPVFFVKKADGSLRLVCDWRELNRITIKKEACLPNMDDLFDAVQGSKYFTKLDLHSGYNQVRIRGEDIPKTAVNTFLGHFQIKVMGFGLCNAPATFQTLMNEFLRPYLRKFVIVFLDDILIFSRTWDKHLEHVHAVLDAIRRHQLYCKPTKCLIGALEVLYLGQIITGTTMAPDWEKLKTVRDWPVPETVSQVRSFLGFANFFRRFVPHHAEIAAPLDEVTGKNVQCSWNDGRQNSFDKLKTALLNPPVLKPADTSRPFEVYTDASDLAIGAVLMQSDDEGNHAIADASRKLTAAEKNYTITERETLTVVFALKSWRLYLYKHFENFTDNQAVVYLRSTLHMSKREARWIEFLADFDFSIQHISGNKNFADPLTRQSNPSVELGRLEFSQDMHPDEARLISEGYAEDPHLSHIIGRLQSTSARDSFHNKYFWDEEGERIYHVDSSPPRLCIPKGPVHLSLLRENHDCVTAGHPGRDKTFWNLSKHFYWPGMRKSVTDFVRTCDTCQRYKST